MRIGIDGGCLANRRGFGRFARQTLLALSRAQSKHGFVVLIDKPSHEGVTIPPDFETAVVDVREAPSKAASATGRRSMRDLLAMGRAASKLHLDLMYFPASYSFFPVWNVGKVVVTMHDTLALAHPELVFPNKVGRLAWTLKEHAAVRWSDRIATVSQAARRDLIEWFGLPETKVVVVPEGPEAVFRPTSNHETAVVMTKYRINADRRFLLYVGGLSPHKNLPRLIEAFSAVRSDDVDLVLVGDLRDVFHTHVPVLKAEIARFGLESRVNFTGFVPDAELAHLYTRAYALVQPSLMEGFGLPPVEAMACGTPVLSSTAGSLPEVVGGAGVFFNPADVSSMAKVISEFLLDSKGRDLLASMAAQRAKQFTWAASAMALLAIFEGLDAASVHRGAA